MRKIEFNQLKLERINDEEAFYQFYLKNLQSNIDSDNTFHVPIKQYEIFYLNILGGKIILLDKDHINSQDTEEQELFFDYSTALKVYNLMLDIIDGIEDEKNESNELYKNKRLQKSKEIDKLKNQDEQLFQKKKEEYGIIINSTVYEDYLKLKQENEKLRIKNQKLTGEINNILM